MLKDRFLKKLNHFCTNDFVSSPFGYSSLLTFFIGIGFSSYLIIFLFFASIIAIVGIVRDKMKLASILSIFFLGNMWISEYKEYRDHYVSKNTNQTIEYNFENYKDVKKQFEKLYSELLNFKNTQEFKQHGFHEDSPYYTWLTEVEKFNTETNSVILKVNFGFVVNDLEMLANAYAASKGSETHFTKWLRNLIDNGLKGNKIYN